MYLATKRIDFCYGHRLLDYDGVCKHPHGHNANNSLVLRGYAKTWLKQVFDEYERVGLVDRLTDE